MAEEDMQMTDDPERVAKVEAVRVHLQTGTRAEIEMYSGLTYAGDISGGYGRNYESGGKKWVGAFIVLKSAGARARLDALDIKGWKILPVPR